MNALNLIVPSLISVAGWGVGAYWAIKQINLAHVKNRELQKEILSFQHKSNLGNLILTSYSEVSAAIENLNSKIYVLYTNLIMLNHSDSLGINFGVDGLVEPINHAYNDLCGKFDRLNLWVDVSRKQIPISSNFDEGILYFNKNFKITSDKVENHPWTLVQASLVAIMGNKLKSTETFRDAAMAVKCSLETIQEKLKDGVLEIGEFLTETKT